MNQTRRNKSHLPGIVCIFPYQMVKVNISVYCYLYKLTMDQVKRCVAIIIIIGINQNLVTSEKRNNFRIIGGNNTTIEQHPWMVSIQFLRVHFCGGSIISEDIILTAAHCFEEVSNGITIVAGSTDLTEEGTSIRVQGIITHESYDAASMTYDYDIAILKLSENLTFSEKIQPIHLPEKDSVIPENVTVVTSGWGTTSEESTLTSNVLLDIQILTIDWQKCKDLMSAINEVTERMTCAGYLKGGRDTCQADSGGALELNSTLIGIVSWGHGCGEADYPGVYTHVGRFRSWIKQHTGI